VDQFFAWLGQTLTTQVLRPSNPFTQAARDARERETALRVFLEYPDVPLDTNHLDSAKFLERTWPSTLVNGGDVFGAAMWWDLLCVW